MKKVLTVQVVNNNQVHKQFLEACKAAEYIKFLKL